MHCGQRGITALDILITLSLVTVLMLVGIPGLREYAANQRIKSAVTRLQADLRLARAEAISLNGWIIACPGDDDSGCSGHPRWHKGWVLFMDLNGDRTLQSSEPVMRAAPHLEGLMALSSSGRSQLRFFPGGSAPASNSSILVCDHRGAASGRKLVLSNSGRIRQAQPGPGDEDRCPAGRV